jgi:hypothetical protein
LRVRSIKASAQVGELVAVAHGRVDQQPGDAPDLRLQGEEVAH